MGWAGIKATVSRLPSRNEISISRCWSSSTTVTELKKSTTAPSITVTTLLSCLPWCAMCAWYGETWATPTKLNKHATRCEQLVGVAREAGLVSGIVTAATALQPHPFSTLNRGPYLPALKTMNKKSLTQAVSKKAVSSIMNHSVKNNIKGQLLFTLVYNQELLLHIIYSQYPCLQLLFMYVVCHNIYVDLQPKQGY